MPGLCTWPPALLPATARAAVRLSARTSLTAGGLVDRRGCSSSGESSARSVGSLDGSPRILGHRRDRPAGICAAGPTGGGEEDATAARDRSSAGASSSSSTDVFGVPQNRQWLWRGQTINYVCEGTSGPAVLLLHGFGVASFHFERNFGPLASCCRVWSVDLLGQGASLPVEGAHDAAAHGPLTLGADTWCAQLAAFIEQVVQAPVYVAGNSLGGYLAVLLGATRPQWVRGLVLLNATPFWAFTPNAARSPGLAKLLSALGLWSGSYPVPRWLAAAMDTYWFRELRRPHTVARVLELVYADPDAIGSRLVEQITGPAAAPEAVDAFASIMFAPQAELDYEAALQRLAGSGLPVALLYGAKDPWVVPLWGQRLKRALPGATYYEIDLAGHCPHHECPAVTNAMMLEWIKSVEAGRPPPLTAEPSRSRSLTEASGRPATVTLVSGQPRTLMEALDAGLYALRRKLGGQKPSAEAS